MNRAFPAAALAALLACAAARAAPLVRDTMVEPTGCSLTVRFGSYAMGIDRPAATKIAAAIGRSKGVAAVTRYRWGREGEYTLCVRTRTAREAAALFERLRPLLPPRPLGPIAMFLADGRSARAPKG